MAIPSIVVGKVWGGSGATEAKYLQGGSTLATLSASDIAATCAAAATNETQFGGPPVIKAFGTRFCVDLSSAGSNIVRIKRLNLITDTWDIVYTATNLLASKDSFQGLYPYQDNGVSGIFMCYMTTTTVLSLVKSTNGVSWSAAVIGTVGAIINNTGRPHLYRNKLIMASLISGSFVTSWHIVDPVGLTVTTFTGVPDGAVTLTQGYHLQPMLATFDNRLFMIFTRAISTAVATLYELVGGAWTVVVTLTGMTCSMGTTGSHALVPYGATKLIAIIRTDNGGVGTKSFDLTPSGSTFTPSETTTTIIPVGLRGGSGTTTQRWTGFVDDVTDPANPTAHFFLLSDDNPGTFTYYEYGTGSGIMNGFGGPATNYLLPHSTVGGGSYIAAANDMDVRSTGQTPILAGTRIGYIANGLISALSRRFSVQLATAAALPSNTSAGSGVGKTLTATANAILSIDGVTVMLGTRVLIKDEVTSANNGIYTVTAVGSGAAAYILTRVVDFDSAAEVFTGVYVLVGSGTVNANTTWQLTTSNPITVDTTGLTFTQMTSTAGTLRRAPCRVATAASLPAYTVIGSGVGKMLTGNSAGVLTIDGVATVLGNRVVVNHHTTDNGVYTVTTEGTGGVPYVLTRSTDFDQVAAGKIMPSAYVYVSEGTSNGNQFWELTTNGQITLESTSLTFTSRLPISLKMYYNTLENTNMTQGTLFGTATGGDSIRNGNQIDRVSPDGIEPFTMDWKAGVGGDGLQNGQAISAFLRLNV